MLDGAAWEEDSAKTLETCVGAVGGKRFKPKRLGTKPVKHVEQLDRTGTLLNADQSTLYRAPAARLNYLSMDRADVAVAAKELCSGFAAPTHESVENLKNVVRYRRRHPRLAYHFDCEDPSDVPDCFVDTDVAGCVRTRRSTCDGVLMAGTH